MTDAVRDPTASLWRRAFGAIDARVVGMTALFALGKAGPIDVLAFDELGRGLEVIARSELTGALVLLFCALLLRLTPLPRPVALAAGVISGCLLAYALMAGTFAKRHYAGFPGGDPSEWTVVWFFARRAMFFWGILAAAWYFMDRAAQRQARLHESAVARRQLESRLVEARLSVMQAQVEPHFLFNTLAHLKRLFKTDVPLAQKMLRQLCDYLRAAFPLMREEASTLGRELALAAAYLEVQRLRMGPRLTFDIDVADRDRQRPFPSMMLMSLVENAVKHGINPLVEGGHIRVHAQASGDALRVAVADTGGGMSELRGSGVGLANIANRLAAIYGAAGRLTLVSNQPRGLRAMIDIPLAEPALEAVLA